MSVHDDETGSQEKDCTEGYERDTTDMGGLAAFENGAAVEQLDDNNMEGYDATTKCCDVILKEGVCSNELRVVIDLVQQDLLRGCRYIR